MADNEIITVNIEKYAEALNNLIGVDSAYFNGDKDVDAIIEIITIAKKMEGIINRQNAEIERLSHKCEDCAGCTMWKCDCLIIKDEAIKEFAERLKPRLHMNAHISPFANNLNDVIIDNLAKEMMEEK